VALTALVQPLNFCTELWAHHRERNGASRPAEITVRLNDGTERTFAENYMVFDWSQANSTSAGQLNSALAALKFWLGMEIDKETDIAPFVDKTLRECNSASVLGVLVSLGKHRPDLFCGCLRPLLGSLDLYFWDDYRVEALPHHFNPFAWSRAGNAVYE